MRITYNEASAFALRSYKLNNRLLNKDLKKLSSGYRINSASDDEAGLAISEKLRTQTRGAYAANKNIQDALSLLQTAEGGYEQVGDILQRLRTLSVQASSDTLTNDDRKLINQEKIQLIQEIDRLKDTVEFNDIKLFDSNQDNPSSGIEGITGVWAELTSAIAALSSGTDQTVNFSISFMTAGVTMDSGVSTELKDQIDGTVSSADFQNEVLAAATEWKKLFESVYNTSNGYNADLTVNFNNIGTETGTSVGSDSSQGDYALPNPDNIGDIRVGMHYMNGKFGVLAHAYFPGGELGTTGHLGGDVHFDSADDWRLDTTDPASDPDSFSIKLIAAHELGHSLGLGHSSGNSIMKPSFNTSESFASLFPGGLQASQIDISSVEDKYGDASAESNSINSNSSVFKFHVGSNQNQIIEVTLSEISTSTLGIDSIDLSTREGAENAIKSLDTAITRVAGTRAEVGSKYNRLMHTLNINSIYGENVNAAESRIRDADIGKETVSMTKNQILTNASNSILSQANLAPNVMLSLLS